MSLISCSTCRDENAFKQHSLSEGHVRQMLVVGEHASSYISQYSNDFQHDFLALLSRRWGTKRVRANQVYQEFIQDKHHSHMNATRWVTLTAFILHLSTSGIIHADETEKGWFISWIDSSPKALAKQDAALKKERQDMNDEERERRMLKQQMERVRAAELEKQGGEDASTSQSLDEEQQDQQDIDISTIQPIKMSFAAGLNGKGKEPERPQLQNDSKPGVPVEGDSVDIPPSLPPDDGSHRESTNDPSIFTPVGASSLHGTATTISAPKPKMNALKLGNKPNPLKANPLKGSNTPMSEPPILGTKRPISAVESIVMEEMEKKRRREQSTWSGARGHGKEGLQRK